MCTRVCTRVCSVCTRMRTVCAGVRELTQVMAAQSSKPMWRNVSRAVGSGEVEILGVRAQSTGAAVFVSQMPGLQGVSMAAATLQTMVRVVHRADCGDRVAGCGVSPAHHGPVGSRPAQLVAISRASWLPSWLAKRARLFVACGCRLAAVASSTSPSCNYNVVILLSLRTKHVNQ